MSEPAEEFIVPADPQAAFGALLGFLAPEEDDTSAASGDATDGTAGAGAGQQPAPAEGAPAAGGAAGAPAAGDGGVAPVPAGAPGTGPATGPAADGGGTGAAPAGTAPADASGSAAPEGVDAATILPKFGEIATGFEQRQTAALEQSTFEALQTEYPKHFEAIRKHPRLLVGTQVPSLRGDGMETLKDSADAKEWQEATKALLLEEVASRVDAGKEEMRDVFATVHSSIELFQNNTDLIPGTKQFDTELATAFAAAAKPYELKSNGKLIGWSVPVQPIINAIRSQQAAAKAAAAAAAPAAPTPQQQRAAEQPRTAGGQFDAPQAGILSQAGQSAAPGDDVAQGVLGAFFRQNGVVL